MKLAVAIRHVSFEDLGNFGPVLAARGFEVRYIDCGTDDVAAIDPFAPDLLIVLGGPIGAYEDDLYPFIKDEVSLLEQRLKARRPTLGVCLGAQMIARTLGARVYPAPHKEIGWSRLTLTAAGGVSPLQHLKSPVLHWHGDTFDLPRRRLCLPPLRNASIRHFPGETMSLRCNSIRKWSHEISSNGLSAMLARFRSLTASRCRSCGEIRTSSQRDSS